MIFAGVRGGYGPLGAMARGAPNTAPVATITSPASGFYTDAETVELRGSATDAEDGALTGASLVWSSNIDGELGTGAAVDTTLSAGSHVLTLTATDADGATGTDTVAVTVTVAPFTRVRDTFTDSNGTGIEPHTPDIDDVGAGWTDHGPTGSTIQGNELVVGRESVVLIDAGTAEGEVRMTATGDSACWLVFRADGPDDCYIAKVVSTTLYIRRRTGGSETAVDSHPVGSLSYPYTIIATLDGNDVSVAVDGVAGSASFSSSTHADHTHHGIKGDTSFATHGADDFEVVA